MLPWRSSKTEDKALKRSKKLPWIVLSLVLVLMIAGCGNTSDSGTSPQENNTQNNEQSTIETDASDTSEKLDSEQEEITDSTENREEANSGSDVLVVYFSRTGEQYNVGVVGKGNTAIVAEMIAEETGADTFEILPESDTYPTTYDELTDVAMQEQKDNARPAIKGGFPDLSQYNSIFIGAPVWWGDWPMICYTYFEANDFSGKTLIPFSTHEGSGLSGFGSKLSSAASGADVKTGLSIRGQDAQNKQGDVRETVKDWLAGLGF